MRAKEYPLLLDALLVGARRATNRTLKYMEKDSLRDPDVQAKIEEEFVDCAALEICERFDLDTGLEFERRVEESLATVLYNLQEQVSKGQPAKDGQEEDEGEAR